MSRPEVLVIGDVMLDRLIEGPVHRISPEAPVPIVRANRILTQLGGAGNVAANLNRLGCKTWLLGLTGADQPGLVIRGLCEASGIFNGIEAVPGKATIVKTRVASGAQQLVRVDEEEPYPPGTADEALAAHVEALFKPPHALQLVVVADYDKGTLSPALIYRLQQAALTNGVLLFVDARPAKARAYYRPSLLKMNLGEALELAAGEVHPALSDRQERVEFLLRFLQCGWGAERVIITAGADGAYAAFGGVGAQGTSRARVVNVPSRVFDATGAGDTVLAVLAAAHAWGSREMPEMLRLAVAGGSLAVQTPGLYLASWPEILDQTRGDGRVSREYAAWLAGIYRDCRRIVLTNGCFDLLHPGHLALLREAKQHGDLLFVAVNSDASARALKGEGRPVQGSDFRQYLLAQLPEVDYVFEFDETNAEQLVRQIGPHVLVKGREYLETSVPGADWVASRGGEVVFAEMLPGFSTTGFAEKLAAPS